ncbi:DDE_4 domain-containing protein, partial [Cephalotus follicularis]
VGALDGTLVHAIIPASQQTVYRGIGKGKCYQNVLRICDFNMIFTFVYAGWEGVAHDSRVLTEVMAEPSNNFLFPAPSKYNFCDASYTNTRGFMTPYRNVRYWLGDFYRRRAMTKDEKFNHAHAKLRNVIERAYVCFAVNNFIRKEKINDELFAQYE